MIIEKSGRINIGNLLGYIVLGLLVVLGVGLALAVMAAIAIIPIVIFDLSWWVGVSGLGNNNAVDLAGDRLIALTRGGILPSRA